MNAQRTLLLAIVLAVVVAAPADAKLTTFTSQSIDGDEPLQGSRVSQNGQNASCASPKTLPGVIPNANTPFDKYTFTNDGPGEACTDVRVDGSGCGSNQAVHAAAYQPSFDPNSVGTNYKGDFGSSSNSGEGAKSFAFKAAPGNFDLDVHAIGTIKTCGAYNVAVRVPPSAATNPVDEVTINGARAQASINEESEDTTFRFVYGLTQTYTDATATSALAGSPDNATHSVSAKLGPLAADTEYHFAIEITYGANGAFPGATVLGADRTFRTAAAPTATTGNATGIGIGGATVHGSVNPGGATTKARFEFGKTTAYGSSTVNDLVGDDRNAHPVEAALGGLEPGTTYHYRVVATQGSTVVNGADQTFTTNALTTVPPAGGDPPAGGGSLPPITTSPGPVIDQPPPADRVAPAFGAGPSLTPKTIKAKKGATINYSLSEGATVSFKVERAVEGRKVKGTCRAPSRKTRKAPRCTRFVGAKGGFTHEGVSGANSVRLDAKKLAPGTYRLTAIATDAAGNRSAPKTIAFKVVS
jgi:hypothetical protein